MEFTYAEDGAEVIDTGREMAATDKVAGLMILASPDILGSDGSFEQFLQTVDTPVFGGVFPELIHRGEKRETGAVLCGLTTEPEVMTVPELSDPEQEYTEQLHPTLPADGYATAFVFVDAYATEIERFVESLFRTYSVELNYIGGGTGSLETEQQRSLFTNDGILQDCAVVAAVDLPVDLGVKHGWQEIAGPFRVTDADGPTVNTLDGDPAFSVYKETVDEQISAELTRDNFFEIAKGYPFGVARIGGEKIVRDPFEVTSQDGLNCFGDVPEGEFVHILHGEPASLIDAAGMAKEEAHDGDQPGDAVFFFDCISRGLYLQEEFDSELARVEPDDTELFGALTIGEIANDGTGHLDYYNKTAVVGAVRRP
jgi:hypothetical protein